MSNLIDRQVAIDAVLGIRHMAKLSDGDKAVRMSAVNYVLRNLPSAEPEIIRCKECKEFRRWIDTDITFCDRTEYEVKEDDFCSRAERKVKTNEKSYN